MFLIDIGLYKAILVKLNCGAYMLQCICDSDHTGARGYRAAPKQKLLHFAGVN